MIIIIQALFRGMHSPRSQPAEPQPDAQHRGTWLCRWLVNDLIGQACNLFKARVIQAAWMLYLQPMISLQVFNLAIRFLRRYSEDSDGSPGLRAISPFQRAGSSAWP
ncbi:MAG: hypothetical protein ACKVOX_06445 [Rhizobacter sp.]